MKLLSFVRRYRWSILIVLVAIALWWPTFNYLSDFRAPDVPFVPTPHEVVKAMLELAEVNENDTLYDLGSGDGRIVLAAVRDRGARAIGIEIDPKLADQAQNAIRRAGLTDRAQIWRGDLFKYDLTQATVVTMYLMPLVNVRLRPQLDRLRPGTRIVSHHFSMPGAKPNKVLTVQAASGMDHPIYLWITPIEWE